MIGSWTHLCIFFRCWIQLKRRGGEDKLWWIPSKRGLFKVKVLYHSLGCNVAMSFPWKIVW
jgi:hypothetical protein